MAVVLLGAAAQPTLCGPAPSQQAAAPGTRSAPPPEARVDINRASLDELLRIPSMTPTWAGRIIRFRPYRTRQDLLDKGVLPSNVYDRIKDYVIAHREERGARD